MKEHSKVAWDVAYKFSGMLASETRDLAAHIDILLRKVIDQTWGEALEDGSVPSTKLQDKIIEAVGHQQSPNPEQK